MSMLFRLFMWYQDNYGMMPKMIKSLRAEGKHVEADALLARHNEAKKNRPKSAREAREQAMAQLAQNARDKRLTGNHAEADEMDRVVNFIQKNGVFGSVDKKDKRSK